MKAKVYTLAMMMAALFGLQSCDWDFVIDGPDRYEARVLSGQWTGDFGMYYEYQYGGRVYRFDSYDTDITFVPKYSGAKRGYGYQVDWYEGGPYTYLNYYFTWSIRDGVIYMDYPGNEEWNTEIYDCTGYVADSNSRVRLTKIRDAYDWTPYYDMDFGWGYNDGWGGYYPYYDRPYYVKGQTRAATDVPQAITRGNRYSEPTE